MSIASIIVFQLGAGMTIILSWKPGSVDDEEHNLFKFACIAVNVISTLSYLMILIWYTRHLREKPCNTDEDDCDDEDSYF